MTLVVESPKIETRSEWNKAVSSALSDTVIRLEQDSVPNLVSKDNLSSFIEGQIRGREHFPHQYPQGHFEMYFTKDETGIYYADFFVNSLSRQGVLAVSVSRPKNPNPNLPGIRVRAYY